MRLFFVIGFCLSQLATLSQNRITAADKDSSGTLTWSLGEEFQTGATRENPNFDREDQPTWYFLRTTSANGPVQSRQWLLNTQYLPLTEAGEKLFTSPLDGWAYRADPPLAPLIGQITADYEVGLKFRAGDLVMAPGPEHAAVIGWRSPVAGILEIQGSFEHGQDCCGVNSQIKWYVEYASVPGEQHEFRSKLLASGEADFGTATQRGAFHVREQTVQPGDYIYFVVDAKADGTETPHHGDLTRFQVTLTVRDARRSAPASFENDILPLLAKKCHDCHGGDLREARLDLRTLSSMLRGGENGPAVVRGVRQTSLLVEKVASGEMPPGKEKLSPAELALIRQWVKSGLQAREQITPQSELLFTLEEQSHWAFRPLVSPPIPTIRDAGQDWTTIDRFLLARLQEKRLSFARPADRSTLLRRVTFGLTGLPPTVDELAEFENDSRADAYERIVERLMKSPQFGVRWGRHWLDIVGYTDTVTFDEDFGAPRGFLEGKWRYRDYVIDAFNRDLPYDQFIHEQLAGDELVEWRTAAEYSPEIVEKLTATGFLRTPEDLTVDDPRPFVIWSNVHETVEQISASFLGLSLQCARCHSHKFEPIPQRDYYSLMALLTPALNPKDWKNARQRLLPDVAAPVQADIEKCNGEIDRSVGEAQQQIDTIRHRWEVRLRDEKLKAVPEPIRLDLIAALALPADKQDAVQKYLVDKLGPLVKVEPAAIDAALTETDRESVKQFNARIAELKTRKRTHGWIHAVYDVGPPPATHVFKRGEFDAPGREAPPGFLRVLSNSFTDKLLEGKLPNTSGRRTALARWITDAESPASGLAARVMVNRIWQQLFGQALSVNSENVGMSGSAPAHPELLEWLAADFRDNDWRIKRIIRQIVLSAAYRQSSAQQRASDIPILNPTSDAGKPPVAASDAGKPPVATAVAGRLDAESLRDAIVMQSGRLDLSLGGPPIPLDYDLKSGRVSEKELVGTACYRRSVYLENRRVYNPTFLSTFDKPIVTRGVCRREQSATAPQSLALMNDPFIVTSSERCADVICSRVKSSQSEQVHEAYRLILCRTPDDEEKHWCLTLLADQTVLFEKAGRSSDEAARQAVASLCQSLWGTNEFLYLR